jgi:hypothetical protein
MARTHERGYDAGADCTATSRLPIVGLAPVSKRSGAVALMTEQAPDRALESLPGWTMRRADCVASATGRLGGSCRARQRPVNFCPRSVRLG